MEPFVLGRCVVSTHVGIADDILVDGENGYFFASEDELVVVFERLYCNLALISKAGNINYSKRQMFAWDKVTERYVELINML